MAFLYNFGAAPAPGAGAASSVAAVASAGEGIWEAFTTAGEQRSLERAQKQATAVQVAKDAANQFVITKGPDVLVPVALAAALGLYLAYKVFRGLL